jgi:hypothetical protein
LLGISLLIVAEAPQLELPGPWVAQVPFPLYVSSVV